VTMSGMGSGGQVSRYDYVLTPLDGGSRTCVEVTADGSGGCVHRRPVIQYANSASA
jgi:hypothetical protein